MGGDGVYNAGNLHMILQICVSVTIAGRYAKYGVQEGVFTIWQTFLCLL
jgi:hypothetical protein